MASTPTKHAKDSNKKVEKPTNASEVIHLDGFLPQAIQDGFIEALIRNSGRAFTGFMRELKKVVEDELKREGVLAKSVQIEFDLEGRIRAVIERHLLGLRYVLLGKLAGPVAKKVAEEFRLGKYVDPGIIHAAYLSAVDANIEYSKLFQKNNDVPFGVISDTMKAIAKEVKMFAEQFEVALRNDLLNNIDTQIALINQNNEHKDLKDQKQRKVLSKVAFREAFSATTERYSNKWLSMVDMQAATASAMGSHQAMMSLFGSDSEMRVVWQTAEDDRVTDFCRKASKDAHGNYRLHRLSDLKPAGFNFGKKRADWVLCVPPAHHQCRSYLIYVPPGFEVRNRILVKKS